MYELKYAPFQVFGHKTAIVWCVSRAQCCCESHLIATVRLGHKAQLTEVTGDTLPQRWHPTSFPLRILFFVCLFFKWNRCSTPMLNTQAVIVSVWLYSNLQNTKEWNIVSRNHYDQFKFYK